MLKSLEIVFESHYSSASLGDKKSNRHLEIETLIFVRCTTELSFVVGRRATSAGGIVLPGSAESLIKVKLSQLVPVKYWTTVSSADRSSWRSDRFRPVRGSNTIEVDGEELILMSEGEIYAVID